jgi:hypothetical protein
MDSHPTAAAFTPKNPAASSDSRGSRGSRGQRSSDREEKESYPSPPLSAASSVPIVPVLNAPDIFGAVPHYAAAPETAPAPPKPAQAKKNAKRHRRTHKAGDASNRSSDGGDSNDNTNRDDVSRISAGSGASASLTKAKALKGKRQSSLASVGKSTGEEMGPGGRSARLQHDVDEGRAATAGPSTSLYSAAAQQNTQNRTGPGFSFVALDNEAEVPTWH